MITCVGFWWQDDSRRRNYRFGIDHVKIWRNMIERHLTLPHQIKVITDDVEAVEAAGIEAVPIDWDKHVPGSCTVKLMMRRPDIGELLGERIFCTDLDIVVVGNIDAIVDRNEDCVWWRNPNADTGDPFCQRSPVQGSIQLFNAGAHSELWSDFDPVRTPRWLNRRFGGAEQAWLGERIPWDEPHWTGDDGIYGAGRLFDGRPDGGITSELPDNARIVSVPGNREPSQPEVQAAHPWMAEHYR